MYTSGAKTIDDVLHLYDHGLDKIESFQRSQKNDVLVGEFSLSNFHHDKNDTTEWQKYADSVWGKIHQKANAGALLWNFDCQHIGWSMVSLES